MIDSSRQITPDKLQKQKNFIKAIARSMNVLPGRSRLALVNYGSTSTPVVDFDSYRNLNELNAQVDNARAQGGDRRIDQALDGASALIRTARSDVPKISILVTGGRHTSSQGARTLEEAAKRIRDLGARTYVVGVGNGPDKNQLRPLVQHTQDVLDVNDFDALQSKGTEIGRMIMSRSGKNTGIPHRETLHFLRI